MSMHVRKTTVEAVPPGLRRTSMGRMRLEVDQVRTLKAQRGVALGAISHQHLVAHQERQPRGRTSTAVPTNKNNKKAMSLDAQRAEAETNTLTNEDWLATKIRTQMNGSWA